MKSLHKGQNFIKGTSILFSALAFVKIIGALFKIPLNHVIGEAGMGYFGTAYTIYNPIFCLSTAGFPVAVSRMVSEYSSQDDRRKITLLHRLVIPLFLFLGFTGTLLMILGADPLICWMTPEDTYALPSIYVLAPGVFFSVLSSAYRGYHEGFCDMVSTAISQVLEAAVKLFLGLTLAWSILHFGMAEYAEKGCIAGKLFACREDAERFLIPYASAGAIFGVTSGAFLSFCFLWVYDRKYKHFFKRTVSLEKKELSDMRRALLRTALPIGLGSLSMNISSLVDTITLQNSLTGLMQNNSENLWQQYGRFLPVEENQLPIALFGCYTNAMTLFMLIPAFAQAVGVSALPNVTVAWTSGDTAALKQNIESVLRITVLFTFPAGFCLSLLSEPITMLLGFNPITGKILILLGLAAIFSALCTPIFSMLQAVGRMYIPVKLMLLGLVIKTSCNYVFISIPKINVLGAGAGSLLCYFCMIFLGLHCLIKASGVEISLAKIFLPSSCAGILGAFFGWWVYTALFDSAGGWVSILISLLAAILVWGGSVLILRVLRKEEVMLLPKGQKIAKILEKRHWIR